MPSIESLGVILLGFLLGSFPTAYLMGKWRRGIDIRGVGSGNPGATNIGREVGVASGILVLAVDAAKGVVAIVVGQRLGVPPTTLYFTALAAVVAHNFSPFLGFRGGKGAATVLGISMLMLWQITAISGAIGLLALAATRHVVWAMTAVFIALNALTIATGQPLGQIILCIVLSLLVACTHFGRQRAYLLPALAYIPLSKRYVGLTALAAVVAHNFSPFLGFRGGKGAATVLGISMLMLWQITAISGAIGLLALAAARHVVWAMTAVFIALNALTIATGQPLGQIILCIVLSLLVAGTHFGRQRTNLLPAIVNRDWRRFMSID